MSYTLGQHNHIGQGKSKTYTGSILLPASVLFTDLTFTRVKNLFDMVNLAFVSESTFNSMQREVLIPVIYEQWTKEKENCCVTLEGWGTRFSWEGMGGVTVLASRLNIVHTHL